MKNIIIINTQHKQNLKHFIEIRTIDGTFFDIAYFDTVEQWERFQKKFKLNIQINQQSGCFFNWDNQQKHCR